MESNSKSATVNKLLCIFNAQQLGVGFRRERQASTLSAQPKRRTGIGNGE
jgi:hypothetical protein